MTRVPSAKERKVEFLGSVLIDGAPIAYIATLSAIVLGLAVIPLSIVIGSGKSFPMSQAIYPLVGWILGPVAGAVANGLGAWVGTWLFPHTTTVPFATVVGAIFGGFAAGAMRGEGKRRQWWILVAALGGIAFVWYAWRAVVINGVELYAMLLGSFIDWSALLLYILPTRSLFSKQIASADPRQMAVGLFLGTWSIAGLTHLASGVFVYFIINWPNPIWLAIAPFAPLEHLLRCLVGAIIGSGVIRGLRAVGLVKPKYAVY